MPRTLVLLVLGLVSHAFGADLDSAGPIYFWPMPGSLDQYMAQRAQASGGIEVTVDPKLARAVMTDRIDAPFLAAMDELFPPEGEPAEARDESIEGDFRMARPRNRPKGSPSGTVFLVDVASRSVLWSTDLGSFDSRPKNLRKSARRAVERLEKAAKGGSS